MGDPTSYSPVQRRRPLAYFIMAKYVVANCLRGGADATSWFTSILDAQSCKKWLAAKPLPWYKKALKAILREAEGEKKAALQRDMLGRG